MCYRVRGKTNEIQKRNTKQTHNQTSGAQQTMVFHQPSNVTSTTSTNNNSVSTRFAYHHSARLLFGQRRIVICVYVHFNGSLFFVFALSCCHILFFFFSNFFLFTLFFSFFFPFFSKMNAVRRSLSFRQFQVDNACYRFCIFDDVIFTVDLCIQIIISR